MSVFIKGLLTCSVGPLKLSLRFSSFGYHLVSWRAITGPNFKPGGQTNPEISRGGAYAPPLSLPLKSQRSPYEGLNRNATHCTPSSKEPSRVSIINLNLKDEFLCKLLSIAQPLALPYFHIVTPLSLASRSRDNTCLYHMQYLRCDYSTPQAMHVCCICDVLATLLYSNNMNAFPREIWPTAGDEHRGCAFLFSSEFLILETWVPMLKDS